MRKKKNWLKSFLLGIIFPFFTIVVISSVCIFVYEQVRRDAEGNGFLIYLVMFLTVGALSMLFVIGDLLRRKITNETPVREILEATEKIASGDFSVRLMTAHSFENYNDYDLIKENLNAMAKELEKSEILKTDFISNLSHELKTPLSIIQNYIFLLQGDLDGETKKKYIDIVVSATKRLTSLVTNILKLNKLENQTLNLEYEKINLSEMLAEVVLSYEEIIDKKQIELECDFDEVEIVSCSSYLEIIWNNLLSNAIKFTENGGKITVKLKKDSSKVLFEVTDTGCGISQETGARIFDKFYQGDTSHSGEGNGLGLALVKKVIDIIGGEISVKSELGKGSTFRVVLKDGN